ncbi:ADP-ribosylglycohydrolase family protein [Nocardia sp. NPDC127579]|uniref:ADP-ribosylglycohydrolase family protein n=1 Tax=Nocardia sp. NPDC127579 TaxID=3345402 RepID=UPI003644FDE0
MEEYAEIVDKVRGAFLGGAVGDALGWPIEFLSLDRIREEYGSTGVTGFLPGRPLPHRITDDTQMTLFSAEALLRTPPGADPIPALRRAYLRWLDTQRGPGPGPAPDGWLAAQQFLYDVRAPGNACMGGLQIQRAGYQPPVPLGQPGTVNTNSKGCGTVMRSAPFGLAGLGADVAFDVSARAAQLTHGHPTGYLAAGAFSALLDRILGGLDLRTALAQTIAQLDPVPGSAETVAALETAIRLADDAESTPEVVEQVGAGWIAEECLAVAVYCALRAEETKDIRAALLLSVNHSGDSDSTGSVAGNLLGAVHGLSKLPMDWVAEVEGRDVILQVADDLVVNFGYRDRARIEQRYPLDLPE